MFSSANFLICTPEQHYIRFLCDSRHRQLQILKGHTEDYQLNITQIKTRKKERKKSSDRFQSLFPTISLNLKPRLRFGPDKITLRYSNK